MDGNGWLFPFTGLDAGYEARLLVIGRDTAGAYIWHTSLEHILG